MKATVFTKPYRWVWIWMGLLLTLGSEPIKVITPHFKSMPKTHAKLANLPKLSNFTHQLNTVVEYEPDELILAFEDTTSAGTKTYLATVLNTTVRDALYDHTEHWTLVDSVVVFGTDTISGMDSLAIYVENNYPYVVFAEPNYIYDCHGFIPNDPNFGQQWALSKIKAPEAWDITSTSPSVKVAILDTGFDYNHPDLANNLWINPDEIANNGIDDDNNGYIDDVYGYDFVNNDNDPMDDNPDNHGTHVAGIIGAEGNNNIGVAGVTHDVQLMNLKVFHHNGRTNTRAILKAINYAIAEGADILNNSWGGTPYTNSIYKAIQRTQTAGQLFVVAAGNYTLNNDVTPFYPASYDLDNIISVGATDNLDQKPTFSHYGPTSVDLFAPGVSIYSTKNSAYGYLQGTSMAAPYVTGALALMMDEFPQYDAQQLKTKLLASVDTFANLSNKAVSGGRLNLDKAMNGLSTVTNSNIIYVNHAATGNNGGTSWSDAYTDLQSALTAGQTGDEIWVAQGTYYPTSTIDRSISFDLKPSIVLYGGFQGIETDISQRDWENNLTILSGNIGYSHLIADNSYHVVRADTLIDTTTVLDGFVVEKGYSNNYKGGGLYLDDANPIIRNCTIRDNHAYYGGGIYSRTNNKNLYLLNCTLSGNNGKNSHGYGGGIYVEGGRLIGDSLSFNNNSQGYGGAIYAISINIILNNSLFNNNHADNGGAIYFKANDSIFIHNTVFNNNHAYNGGAISHYYASTNGSFSIYNTVFNNNHASDGGALFSYGGSNNKIIIEHTQFNNNYAAPHFGSGGAINISTSSNDTKIINSTFKSNYSAGNGGAIKTSGNKSFEVINSKFISNYLNVNIHDVSYLGKGGAIYVGDNQGNSLFENVTFIGNTSNGTMGGAVYCNTNSTSINCLFVGNKLMGVTTYPGTLTYYGGAYGMETVDTADFINCTFAYNGMSYVSLASTGGAIGIASNGMVNAKNSIFWQNTHHNNALDHFGTGNNGIFNITHGIVEGGYAGIGNMNTLPAFINAMGADSIYGTIDDDYRLLANSPAIDAGNGSYPNEDLLGKPRIGNPDIGCYEFDASVLPCDSLTLNLGSDTSICTNTFTLTIGLSNMAHTIWSTGDSTTNIIVNSTGYYAVSVMDSCGNTASDTIHITLDTTCYVYPGDANEDGIVNYRDLLPIGQAFGKTGAVRPNATTNFTPQPCPDWTDTLPSGVNNKHQDCNGDGTVDLNDPSVIIQNYGQSVGTITSNYQLASTGEVELSTGTIEYNAATQILSIPLVLNNTQGNNKRIYNHACRIDYGGFGNLTPTVNLDNSMFGQKGINMESLVHIDAVNKTIDLAITRTDHTNVISNGIVGKLDYYIQTLIIGGDSLFTGQLDIIQPLSQDSAGVNIPIVQDTFQIQHILPSVVLQSKIYLEGAYDATTQLMRTDLVANGYLPDANMIASSILPQVVDWVTLELRDKADSTLVIDTIQAVVLTDGTIATSEGTTMITFPNILAGSYYVVVKHRNHLDVMTAQPVLLESGITSIVDFTDVNLDLFGGINGIKQINGVRMLYAGDADGNGQIAPSDKNAHWQIQVGESGYKSADINLNGQVAPSDKNDYWLLNSGKGSQVPN